MVSIRNYFTIVILMVTVFVMFMFAGVSLNLLSDTATNRQVEERAAIYSQDTITADSLNLDTAASSNSGTGRTILHPEQKLQAAILSKDTGDTISQLLTEWCVYHKYLYKVYPAWPDAEEMAGYDIALFGDYNITSEDSERLYAYADLGITMIFTRLPDYKEITLDRNLAAFFGIRAGVMEDVTADGIKIFSDFMLSKERIYRQGDYFGEEDDTEIHVPYYSLRAGYELYAVGILNHQKELGIEDRELPPLLWRTVTDKSFVFAVNTDIFDGMSMLGVLTGFMARQEECYLYPIVNAQTISLIDYPYFSDENKEAVQKRYSRSSEAVARDILWPNIIQILKNYGGSYSFFAASQLDYLDGVGPKEDYLSFYLREIDKLPGSMGLSLGQVSDAGLQDIIDQNASFYQRYLPEYDFTALYTADFHTEEVQRSLHQDFLKNISLVMSDYRKGDALVRFLDDQVLSVKFNLRGTRHETMDDLQMICVENALGMCNMKMDIGRVIYPEDSFDEWNYLSLKWSKGDTYYKDFSALDMVSIYEMENRVRRFLALDYTYEYDENHIDISLDHFDEEAYFLLFTQSGRIDHVENGTAEKISDTAYLIRATAENVRIHISEELILKKPKNHKTIPSNPENNGAISDNIENNGVIVDNP